MFIIGLSFLLLLAIVMFLIALGVAVWRDQERKKVRGFLAQLDENQELVVKTPLVMRAARSASAMSVLLGQFGFTRKLEIALLQSGMDPSPFELILVCAVLMLAGSVVGFVLRGMIPEP